MCVCGTPERQGAALATDCTYISKGVDTKTHTHVVVVTKFDLTRTVLMMIKMTVNDQIANAPYQQKVGPRDRQVDPNKNVNNEFKKIVTFDQNKLLDR